MGDNCASTQERSMEDMNSDDRLFAVCVCPIAQNLNVCTHRDISMPMLCVYVFRSRSLSLALDGESSW